jgi:ATP-dependent DNA helicase RecG
MLLLCYLLRRFYRTIRNVISRWQDLEEQINKTVLPVLAVREALVNAICHRDYSNRPSFIALAIFDDRIEIWNKGKLPPDLNIDDLKKKHLSEPRNENIAKVFYDRKYFDGWGTGIARIFDLCRESDIPEPKYEQYSGGTEIIFKFKEPIAITYVQKGAVKQNLSSRQQAILALIKEHGAISIQRIMSGLIEPPSQRMVKKDLNYLKEIGLVELKGSARTAVWQLK